MSKRLTHLKDNGSPHIVDLSVKRTTQRMAQAEGWILLSNETIEEIRTGGTKKGDVLLIAQLAGICGAKKTSDLIPLCHPIPIDSVSVELEIVRPRGVRVFAEVRNEWKTGVEMEALTAVTTAALCVYDMIKAIQKDAMITDIRLIYKEGGKSGVYGIKNKPKEKT
jgi:cyclic pyranopterin phosphate synthase